MAESDDCLSPSRQEPRDRQAFLDWLAPTVYHLEQTQYARMRYPGTGEWFLNSGLYQRWIHAHSDPGGQTPASHTLFCPGRPGAGKTILTSAVVEDLTCRFPSGPDPNVGVAYIYCDFRLQEEQLASDLLLSLLRQLLRPGPLLPSKTEEIYRRKHEPRERPSASEISAALEEVVATYVHVFVVVDALDECLPEHRTGLLEGIFRLQAKYPVCLLATSNLNPGIAAVFTDAALLEIRADDQDVRTYLGGHMSQLLPFLKDQPALEDEVKDSITRAADGR